MITGGSIRTSLSVPLSLSSLSPGQVGPFLNPTKIDPVPSTVRLLRATILCGVETVPRVRSKISRNCSVSSEETGKRPFVRSEVMKFREGLVRKWCSRPKSSQSVPDTRLTLDPVGVPMFPELIVVIHPQLDDSPYFSVRYPQILSCSSHTDLTRFPTESSL